MKDSKKDNIESKHTSTLDTANRIAMWVIILSFGSILMLGLVLGLAPLYIMRNTRIFLTSDVKNIKDLMSTFFDFSYSLLPVIGAWMGAVIAYYFSRDNFESAAKSTGELVRQLKPEEILRKTGVTEAMVPMDQIKLTEQKTDSKIQDVIKEMDEKNANRLPIFGKNREAKYILHKSILHQFMIECDSPENPMKDLTLQSLLDNPKYKPIAEAFCVLPESATLADAKRVIDQTENCSDVFITKTGQKTDPVTGWLTNVGVLSHLPAS
ncbi:hypothetical protein [Candidatus Thiosymbion oneisti]|nr:hypothetical protein [Candidatus Thiosymbion oneisti]